MANRRPRSNPIDTDWFEVFLRVDPNYIFNCVLVSKEWLQVIGRPEFRSTYEKRWKSNSKLVGFLKHGVEIRYLWSTRKLACMMKTSKPMQNLGSFESKSSSRDGGHILFRTHNGTFYVSHRIAAPDALLIKLPPPPVTNVRLSAAITSENPNRFKVILAAKAKSNNNALYIQTFSSSTGIWEFKQSSLPSVQNELTGKPGFVSSKGVVYWQLGSPRDAKLAAYNTNNQVISFVSRPKNHDMPNACTYTHYCVSPQGSLYCATHLQFCNNSINYKPWDFGTIKLWVLDDDDGERWILMDNVELKSMWAKHSAALEPFFGGKRPPMPFTFVSFVPGTSDCFYVKLEEVVFRYHLHTQELDRVFGSCDPSRVVGRTFHHPSEVNVPLTVADLGIWPGCSSISIPNLH